MNKPIKASFDYDLQNDILYVKPIKREYYSSIQEKNFIFDLDRNDNINGIEILDVSKIAGVPKTLLSNIESGNMHIETVKKDNGTLVKLHMRLECVIRNSKQTLVVNDNDISESEYLKPAQLMNLATA